MDFVARLPGGRQVDIPGWGNLPVEMTAMLAGVKPVTHAWVDESDYPRVRAMAASLGAKTLVYARREEGGRTRCGVMIGPDASRLDACAAVWESPNANPGEHLGYPPCCVARFWEMTQDSYAGPDFVLAALARTEGNDPLPWPINNLYYMYSRPFRADHPQRREAIAKLNPGLPVDVLNLISWHPCHYRCAASLAYARAVHKTMLKVMPDLADLVAGALARPVLFWDWWRFAALGGAARAKGGTRFAGVERPLTPIEMGDAAALAAGGTLSRGDDGTWSVTPPSGPAARLSGSPALLEFLPEVSAPRKKAAAPRRPRRA
jgi:hypothetical protein